MQRSEKKAAPAWHAPSGRWRPSDGAAMVAAYEASGLSMRAFATKHGVRTQRVAYWRSRTTTASGSSFVPVTVASEPTAQLADEQVLKVSLPGGRSFRVRGRWSATSIKTWLRALEVSS